MRHEQLGKGDKTAKVLQGPGFTDSEEISHDPSQVVRGGGDLQRVDVVRTANWGYVRLRGENNSDVHLRDWADRIKAAQWDDAYVFLMREDVSVVPKLVNRFIELSK